MKKILFVILAIVISGCGGSEPTAPLSLTSSAFANNEAIPVNYSCDGTDATPPLTWTDPPKGTKSFALIMDDPDAGTTPWVHWVIFNIPASARGLDEGLPTDAVLSDGSIQGKASPYTTGYNGPCPPGGTHHYVFKLYALDTKLDLGESTSKTALLDAMEGHILTSVELIGTFER